MSGHTPGPWELVGFKPGFTTFDLFGPGGRQVIARASYENMWLATYDPETDAANARLIAAAPALLEALVNLYGIAEAEGIVGDRTTMQAARAAIQSATGEG